MKGYKNKYGTFSVSGILVLFMLTSWFLVLPYITNVLEKVQLQNELSDQIIYSNNWEENYTELVEYRTDLEEGIRALDKNKLDPEDSYLLIDAIYEAAESAFIKIERINPSDITLNDRYKQIIDIEFTGRYHAIASFINKLENSSYPLVFNEIQLSKNGNANHLNASVTMEIEYNRNQ